MPHCINLTVFLSLFKRRGGLGVGGCQIHVKNILFRKYGEMSGRISTNCSKRRGGVESFFDCIVN